jgi:hypothetical protein
MVTAREHPLSDKVAFLSGRKTVDPTTITPKEWGEFIHIVLGDMTFSYLKGFKPLETIIIDSGYPTKRKRALDSAVSNGGHCGVNLRDQFLHCIEFNPRPPLGKWPKEGEKFLPFRSDQLVVSVHKSFYHIKVEWVCRPFMGPGDLGFEAVQVRAIPVELEHFAEIARPIPYLETVAGLMLLKALYEYQSETAKDLTGQARHAVESSTLLAGHLGRFAKE